MVKAPRKVFTRRTLTIVFTLVSAGLFLKGTLDRFSIVDFDKQPPHHDLDFSIVESSRERGLLFSHQSFNLPKIFPIGAWIQSSGASVSIVDVNHDGFMDIYLTSGAVGAKNALFLNDGTGHFSEQAAKFNLADLNEESISLRSVFLDCDHSGRRALLLITEKCPQLFTQAEDHTFHKKEVFFPAHACGYKGAVSALDIDGDGKLDLVLGGYPESFTTMSPLPRSIVDGDNGSDLIVMHGDGQCGFTEEAGVLKLEKRVFMSSVGVGDLRQTGNADIWISADYTSDKIFLKGEHEYKTIEAPYANPTSGMNSEVLYLDGTAAPFVFVSQAYHKGFSIGGNNLWQYDGKTFQNYAIDRGLHECGWSWGGRGIDLNNDGLLDLAVVNGYISGNLKSDYWFSLGTLATSADFILSDFRFWPNMDGRDLSGHERDCLYVNRGDHFENVAEDVDFDHDKLDGRGVAVIDPDNSGHQHLVVANQKGPLNYYTITPKNNNAWIGFSLESQTGNREAIGAKVIVRAAGKTFVRENYNTNTFASQSDPRLHFGLGSIQTIDDVEVHWPDGKVQHFHDLPLRKYHHLMEM